jgi:hypothetical protein
MRYATPIILRKYLQYHWVAANSKGHGVHSPFVFKFIQEILNAKSTMVGVENSAPIVKKILQEIEAVSSSSLKPKIKLLIARLVQSLNPLTFSVTGELKPFEANAPIDFAFIGEGQDEAKMLQGVNKLIDNMHSNSCIILHGIHTDSTMEAGWNLLKKHSNIRLTIDLFSIGILFCRTAQKEQEHFIIRY